MLKAAAVERLWNAVLRGRHRLVELGNCPEVVPDRNCHVVINICAQVLPSLRYEMSNCRWKVDVGDGGRDQKGGAGT